MKAQKFTLKTERQGYYNITSAVRRVIADSGVQDGICVVFCPHTTGAITINENADPDVQHDLVIGFDEAFPDRRVFRHPASDAPRSLPSPDGTCCRFSQEHCPCFVLFVFGLIYKGIILKI